LSKTPGSSVIASESLFSYLHSVEEKIENMKPISKYP